MFKIPKRDNIGLRDVKGKFTMKVLTFKKKSYFLYVLHESARSKTWISLSLRVAYVAHCTKSKSVSYMLVIHLCQSIMRSGTTLTNKISIVILYLIEFLINIKRLFLYINIFLYNNVTGLYIHTFYINVFFIYHYFIKIFFFFFFLIYQFYV